ncbi:MAG: hypothetical protein R3307_01215 [Anaerolineales bacterium]|nr:hypothetical protein [Anaerolineales bacterium]
MNISSWLDEHKGALRFMILIMFVVSMFGPWMLERLHVPAKYACTPPSIRLEGDFCGSPMSGFLSLVWFAGGFFAILFELIRGVFPDHPRELLSGLGKRIASLTNHKSGFVDIGISLNPDSFYLTNKRWIDTGMGSLVLYHCSCWLDPP